MSHRVPYRNNDIIAVQKIVDKAVGIPKFSYAMYQNAPRPKADSFAAVRLVESKSPCYDEHKVVWKEDCQKYVKKVQGIRLLTIDILFNRDDELVFKFDNAFFDYAVQELTEELGYELISKQPTNLRTTSQETDWEIRTGITCVFSVIRTHEVELPDGIVEDANLHSNILNK